jgi:hypothetical protein
MSVTSIDDSVAYVKDAISNFFDLPLVLNKVL